MINTRLSDDVKAKVFPNEEIGTIAMAKDGTKEVKVV